MVVVNPARLVMIAVIMRRHLVQMSSLRLSLQDRANKSAQMYEYIASHEFADRLTEIEAAATALSDLDVVEKQAHDKVWDKRGRLVQGLVRSHGQIDARIQRIVQDPVAKP